MRHKLSKFWILFSLGFDNLRDQFKTYVPDLTGSGFEDEVALNSDDDDEVESCDSDEDHYVESVLPKCESNDQEQFRKKWIKNIFGKDYMQQGWCSASGRLGCGHSYT